jgi:hypothetical protein
MSADDGNTLTIEASEFQRLQVRKQLLLTLSQQAAEMI